MNRRTFLLSTPLVTAATRLTAVEAIEHPLALGRRDPRAVVADPERASIALLPGGHIDAATARGVTQGVVDEVTEQGAQRLAARARLGLEDGFINQYGGAVAMGHPIGASGARIVTTLINQLRKRGGGYGVATICSGGGQGDALLVRVE